MQHCRSVFGQVGMLYKDIDNPDFKKIMADVQAFAKVSMPSALQHSTGS